MVKSIPLNIATNDNDVHRSLSRILGMELSQISKPCYFPKMIKYREDILHKTNITDSTVAMFLSQLDRKYAKFNLISEKYTVALILGMLHYGKKKDINTSKLFYQILAVKFYSSLVHILFPNFCKNDLWSSALDQISPKHLFKIKHGIPNAITFIADALFTIYEKDIVSAEMDDYRLVRIVYDLRHRIAQSLKSFAGAYYKINETKGMGTLASSGEEELGDIQLIADKISMSICTFSQVDMAALNVATSRSGIRRDLCHSAISELSTVHNRNRVKFILILMSRVADYRDVCKENSRNSMIRKIEAGKQIGKYSARSEILSLAYSLESGPRLRTLNDSQVVMFFSHYLTTYLANKVC